MFVIRSNILASSEDMVFYRASAPPPPRFFDICEGDVCPIAQAPAANFVGIVIALHSPPNAELFHVPPAMYKDKRPFYAIDVSHQVAILVLAIS